jgi:hypothetical protein
MEYHLVANVNFVVLFQQLGQYAFGPLQSQQRDPCSADWHSCCGFPNWSAKVQMLLPPARRFCRITPSDSIDPMEGLC